MNDLNKVVSAPKCWSKGATVLKGYLDCEIFFPIFNIKKQLSDGTYTVANEDEFRLPLVRFNDLKMALFYTTKNNIDPPGEKIGGISLRIAIKMVVSNEAISGLILKNDNGAWVPIQKHELFNLLNIK